MFTSKTQKKNKELEAEIKTLKEKLEKKCREGFALGFEKELYFEIAKNLQNFLGKYTGEDSVNFYSLPRQSKLHCNGKCKHYEECHDYSKPMQPCKYKYVDSLYYIIQIPQYDVYFPYWKTEPIGFTTYSLNEEKPTEVCRMSIRWSRDYKTQASRVILNSIELTDLNSCEARRGHASRLIQRAIQFAKKGGAIQISGMMQTDTQIGIENLREFYRKNGFVVDESTFHMNLTE